MDTQQNNIIRCLDHVFDHCQQNDIDLDTMCRKELNELMYSFTCEAGIPEKDFQLAYAQQISELNHTPSKILQSNNQNMKTVKPMLPIEIFDKQGDEDEPTQRTRITPRYTKVEPYFSPQLLKSMKK